MFFECLPALVRLLRWRNFLMFIVQRNFLVSIVRSIVLVSIVQVAKVFGVCIVVLTFFFLSTSFPQKSFSKKKSLFVWFGFFFSPR